MIKKIFSHFNRYLYFSIIVHVIILILILKYCNRKVFVFESTQRNTRIEMVQVDKNQLNTLRKSQTSVQRKKVMHQGYKNPIVSSVKVHNQIENTESTNSYEITHSRTKPMQMYNKPQTVFDNIKLNQSVQSDLNSLQTEDSEEHLSFVNGDSRNVIDSCHDELAGIGVSINTNVRLQLVINAEGNVLSAEIVTSSGDIDKDSQILAIVNRWKFEEGDLERQTVVVNLKYFVK